MQLLHDLPEQLSIRVAFRKGDPDPADTDPDVRADLEQLQAHGAYTGDSDHRFWFYSIIRSSQRDVSNSITVSDRIQSVHS